MKIAWIYPIDDRCGIHIYSKRFVEALRNESLDIVSIDTSGRSLLSPAARETAQTCNCIHIQYETSFFLNAPSDMLASFCAHVNRPVIVTAHEVYHSFPGVFPRDNIKGKGIIRKIREIAWDVRHPYQRLYTEHERHGFYANIIHVHSEFQKDILISRGISPSRIEILAHPTLPFLGHVNNNPTNRDVLQLSSTGFLTPTYDYSLLISVLERIDRPWVFTWIGGGRGDKNRELERWLVSQIRNRSWDDRFIITGWVPEEAQRESLLNTDIYLALFKTRSASGSLAAAMSCALPIVATSIPLTRDLSKNGTTMQLCNADALEICQSVLELADNSSEKQALANACTRYVDGHTFAVQAKRMKQLYAKVVGA